MPCLPGRIYAHSDYIHLLSRVNINMLALLVFAKVTANVVRTRLLVVGRNNVELVFVAEPMLTATADEFKGMLAFDREAVVASAFVRRIVRISVEPLCAFVAVVQASAGDVTAITSVDALGTIDVFHHTIATLGNHGNSHMVLRGMLVVA